MPAYIKMIIQYSKEDCPLCDQAKTFVKTHNIPIENIVKVNTKYDIAKQFPDLEDDLLDIAYFPIFYDTQTNHIMNYEEFKTRYGEILLNENASRHVLFPIKYDELWAMYEQALASFWTTQEIDFSNDESDFQNKLNNNERFFIKNILAFFASADGIVNENLSLNFSNEVQLPEARAFYSYQQFNETIHSHTYSLMIDTFVKDTEEKMKLFNGVHTIPCVALKAKWAEKWITNSDCFAKRLIAFICVEGIMFSGSFCAIFWLKKRGLMHGLSFSNELIARDEGMHQQFATVLYRYLKNKLTAGEVYEIVKEAVEHEKTFITQSIPCDLIGMNHELMIQYIEFVADRMLVEIGHEKIYLSNNPFDFMETISLSGKTNFFERRVGEYAKAGFMVEKQSQIFALDGDF